MVVVVATISSVEFYTIKGAQFLYTPFKESDSESAVGKAGYAFANTFILFGAIVVMTVFLVSGRNRRTRHVSDILVQRR